MHGAHRGKPRPPSRREPPGAVACVDASLALRLVLSEPGHDAVRLQWTAWARAGTRLVSPCLFAYETTSAIRKQVARGLLPHDLAEEALIELEALKIELVHPSGLEREALALAGALDRPTAYDAFYLALGKLLGCPTWTADERLHRAVAPRAPWVRLITAAQGEH